jgi:hypothetical protein
MDPTMTDVTIKCSRFKALIILFVGIPLLSLIALLFVVIMVSIPLMPKGVGGLGTQNAITIYVLFPLLIVGFSWAMWSVIRNREALFTTIRVSPAGVVVENSRYGVLLLNWNDVTHATYSSFGKTITLESPKLSKPLAIMNFGGRGLPPEFLAARTLIEAAVSNRWSERRL